MPPRVETKPEKKSMMTTLHCRHAGMRASSSLHTNGRMARYDQIISLVLSHSHGANLTKQQMMKTASDGKTTSRAHGLPPRRHKTTTSARTATGRTPKLTGQKAAA